MTLEAGTRVGKYEIRELLGAGGMGEVYRALDTELGRAVALKFLPAEMAADPKRMQRFEQEARAASALNHPNIVTVHDIGQTADGRRFFATELVDGVTLRERMKAPGLKLTDALDIVAQVAAALVEAHGRRIVHRDVKPENVMLRRDGYVKVLDFGLAKLTGGPAGGVDTEAATRALVATDAGAVMGTVSYMSPEQSRGEEVDARTDVWSLGVVLYEMLTGHVPFRGRSAHHTLVAIQDEEPPPLSAHLPEVPDLLQEVVSDALAKDREARLTARQMLAKLQRLKRRVDAGAHLDHSVAPNPSTPSGEVSMGRTASQPGATASGAYATRPAAPAGETQTAAAGGGVSVPGARHVWLMGALALLALSGLGYGLYRFAARDEAPAAVAKQMKISRLATGTGDLGNVTISPDGKYIAYAVFNGAKVSLRVRQVSTGSERETLAPVEDAGVQGMAFSPDGELVYYNLWHHDRSPLGALYQVPVIGGREPKKILEHIQGIISFAPDGRRFAFFRAFDKIGDSALMVASLDGGEPRQLARRGGNDWFGGVPAWSPDGRVIVCPVGTDTGGTQYTLVEVPAEGGPERPITTHRWRGPVFRPAWLKGGDGLILNARELPTSPNQIWRLSYPDGAVSRITNDLTEYGSMSFGLTADSSTIATISSEQSSKVWLAAPNEGGGGVRKLTDGRYDGQNGLDWTPDGRVVYVARGGDSTDIWVTNADGTGQKQLTSNDDREQNVRVSPDGRHVVFASAPAGGVQHVWRMDTEGGDPRQLTGGEAADFDPFWSPDGRWVFFNSWRSGNGRLWKVAAEGGEPTQVSDLPFNGWGVPPGGRLIFGQYYDEQTSPPRWRWALLDPEGGRITRVFDFPPGARVLNMLDERTLVYALSDGDVDNLWARPLDGGQARQLTRFTSERIFWHDPSRDGKQFAVARGTLSADIVLIKDFR